MKINQKEITKIYENFAAGKATQSEIEVEFDSINNIDTLVLLRAMSKEPEVSEFAPIIETALDGHSIKFLLGDKVLKSIAYNRGSGNALHLMFSDEPYLYDLLQQTVYALLLKKLTPHLEDSN